MASLHESNKTKMAKRVIEVFEFFDGGCRSATVMDIVRRYNRPQSSTSELLAGLVEMGLLYKDARSRSFSPTPRLATLGLAAQPLPVRDGRLFSFMDTLADELGLPVAMFGMVGTRVQLFGAAHGAPVAGLDRGASVPLSASMAGLVLLSALPTEQAKRMLWRLNGEAAPGEGFNTAQLSERVAALRRIPAGTGNAGFVSGAMLSAVLLPREDEAPPLCLGVLHDGASDGAMLCARLSEGVRPFSPCVPADAERLALSA